MLEGVAVDGRDSDRSCPLMVGFVHVLVETGVVGQPGGREGREGREERSKDQNPKGGREA